ncbi:hypothetical protein BAUCODRAFT_123824 [Baudoinia panamericana UAMH 10762]|uniref:Peptidase M20 dimerisation domain-containing protein n=1 Tax=Baudoinia panamericana (strain UAMH 10762) TaxID=717646 RepID=M2N8F1_BAUPA|nr:uncharacterized protein BAUCODRAFT_123824 [Baudoinia panamericana UAMH 10762]EMC95379.1 hypothetical protein BAUCODRAFT_123824 [Baudoinia panamericana UAMH 10762]
MEKNKLLPVSVADQPPKSQSYARRILSATFFVCLTLYAIKQLFREVVPHSHHRGLPDGVASKASCVQVPPLYPPVNDVKIGEMWEYIQTPAFRNASIVRHSGAVKIPTESFDNMGEVGEDKRWDIMYQFADYLEATFPRMHSDLKVEKVNTHGLLYTWQGSDESLKPLILMAHQDVVPVPASTVDAWTHPPFSGHYDGKFIWGRGASDCKNQLIAVMETIELFLAAGYEPKRTIVMSFGFDEEISGRRGAGHLAGFLHDRHGNNGVAAIVDEGAGFSTAWDQVFAIPGVGEKGYTDVYITVRMNGGHSSIPTDHTGIGVMSELVTMIEAEQYPTYLADENPMLGLLECGASHAPTFPKKLKKLLRKHSTKSQCKAKPDELALEAAKLGGRPVKYLMQTSQAVDVIEGGVKVNALPERTMVTVNHRINIGDTAETVFSHLTSLAKPVAEKYNLTLHAFDGTKEAASSISMYPSENTLEVAPVTPTNVDTITPYAILAGTTRAVYGDHIIVSPGMMTGNTDTRYYWPLTKHIFRYGPGYDPTWDKGLGNVHTVDERISVDNHLGMVKWFTLFVRNMDEAQLE